MRSVALERLTKRLGTVTGDQLRLIVGGIALSIDYVPPQAQATPSGTPNTP
ncbi:MAG: hypothetical protein ACRDHP_06750 [Ktedonobacterales bacterium]